MSESSSKATPRIEPLPVLPIFFKVRDERVVIAGGTDPAAWKAELLAAAGAEVHVFALDFAEQFEHIGKASGPGTLTLHKRAWVSGDLDGAVLAVGAITDDFEAARFVTAAQDAGIPVNVIDRPQYCDFQFGALVNRAPLVVAISTDGGAPVFGQAIRSWIEQLLPPGFKQWAEAAKTWRQEGDRLGTDISERRRFWELFTDYAIANATRAPSILDRETLIVESVAMRSKTGSVTILALQSDDPDLLTVRDVRALRTADVIIFDAAISPAILSYARREAERDAAGDLETTKLRLIAAYESGKRVVRVALGTGGLSGEIEAVRAAGIEPQIVGPSGPRPQSPVGPGPLS